MTLRKLPGTHKFHSWLVCDRCGYKVIFDQTGRSVMRDHLSAEHAPETTS
jgi:hypothetical protein